jgi:hypothetical protein
MYSDTEFLTSRSKTVNRDREIIGPPPRRCDIGEPPRFCGVQKRDASLTSRSPFLHLPVRCRRTVSVCTFKARKCEDASPTFRLYLMPIGGRRIGVSRESIRPGKLHPEAACNG